MDGRGQKNVLSLDDLYIIGFMSVDVLRQYHADLSQLKFLTFIPKGIIRYNLDENIENAVKRTTDENDEKISLLLKFLLDQKHRLAFLKKPDLTFISYRRTLIDVMISTHQHEPISVVASKFHNCIYLYSEETPQQNQRRCSRSPQNAKFCAWGYKFEQYMLSDLPTIEPNKNRPVIENEEFTLYYSAHLGRHNLVFGAQIDGMLATNPNLLLPPDTKEYNSILNYLRFNEFIELKTNKEIFNLRQEQIFKRYKMIRCWCQCYLAGLKGLLVGYRNDDGIVHRVQWFDTDDIVKYCQNEWESQAAIDYLDHFLSYIENCFKSHMENFSADATKEPVTLRFDIDAFQKITVSTDTYKDNVILPDWYVKNIRT